MALFAGVWQRAGRRLRDGAETDLLASLHGPFHSVLSAYDDPSFVLVARSLNEPTLVSHRGIVAALGGRLDDGVTADGVLDAYLDPAGRFRSICGDYAIAVFDPHHHTLVLLRDAVGTQPLYYHVGDDGTVVFASQIKAVLAGAALTPRPNHAALAQLLVANNGVPRGQTCFTDVHAVPPGQALLVTPDTISLTTHADLRPIVPTPLRTFDESCAAFRRAFLRSVERRMSPRGSTAVFLSGGVDSSAIVAATAHIGEAERTVAISYGQDDGGRADERRYIDAVTDKTGVRHMRVPFEPLGFLQHNRADAWASETPLVDDVPGTLIRAAERARQTGAQHVMIGTWGDQVMFPFPPPLLSELLRAGHVKEFARLSKELQSWMADVPASQIRGAVMRQVARTVLPTALLDRVRPIRNGTMFDLLKGRTMLRRTPMLSHAATLRKQVVNDASVVAMEGSTKWGWSNGVETQLPFLDADLLQLMFAIPAEHALHEGRPKAVLRGALTGIAPDVVVDRRDKGDYTDAIVQEMTDCRAECVDSLESCRRLVAAGLMSAPAAAKALESLKHRSEIDLDSSVRLATLVGVNSWLATFFDAPEQRS